MNEEEKKAIEVFIEKANKYDESIEIKGISIGEEMRVIDTVVKALNLIEKQQKNIEELKEMLQRRIRYTNELEKDLFENANNYAISKDKIREKIKEYENMRDNTCKRNYDENRIKSLNERILACKDLLKEDKQ